MADAVHLKLLPPGRKAALTRRHLVNHLCTGGMVRKVILVQADPGYGKTMLLQEFAEEVAGAAAWYRLDRTDRHLDQFVDYFARLTRNYVPDFVAPCVPADRTRGEDACDEDLCYRLALHFARALNQVGVSPLTIILDNYEEVNVSREVNAFLSALIGFLPSQVHLIISTRERPGLPLSRLHASQDLIELSAGDLALTLVETRTLLADLFGVSLPEGSLHLLQEKTEGWPAGIVMLAQSWEPMDTSKAIAQGRPLLEITRTIRDYFEEEVFNQQSPEAGTFLMKASILPMLDAEMCNEVMPECNAGEILSWLANRGTFLRAAENGPPSFRFHGLFRQYLREQLRLRCTADSIRDLSKKAAAVLEAKREFDEAQRLYMEAGAFDMVADLLERVAEDYLERYMLDIVKTWANAIPRRIRASRPWVLAFQGKTLRRMANGSVALSILEMAWNLFADRGEQFGMAYTAYEAAFTYAQIGQHGKGVETVQQTLARIDSDPALRGRLLVPLCMCYQHLDELDRAEQSGKLALHELAQVPHHPAQPMLESRARQYLAQVYARRGDLGAALSEVKRSLDLCEEADLGRFKRSWALHTLGLVHALQGAWQAGLEALQAAEECGERGNQLQTPAINHIRGNIYRDMGELALAHECYEQCGDSVLAERALLYLHEDRIAEAASLAQEAQRFFAARDSVVDQAIVKVVQALIEERHGRSDVTQQAIEEAATTFSERKVEQLLASAYLQLARLGLANRSETAALRYLRLAFAIAARYNLHYFYWCDPAILSHLVGHALRHDIHAHHASRILEKKLQAGHSRELLPLLTFPDIRVQEVVGHILDTVAHDSRTSLCGAEELLRTCTDHQLRLRILKYVSGELLSLEEILQLRERHKLTWREIEVYAIYYQHVDDRLVPRDIGRRQVAEQLNMSENTLKIHVSKIRRKLGLSLND